MLNDYMTKLYKHYKENKEEVDVSSSLLFNPELIDNTLKKVNNKDSIDDKQLFEFLTKYHKEFLDDVFNKKEKKYIDLFTNSKFLMVFIQVIRTIYDNISYDEKIYCNKIAYDYMILDKTDKYIKSLLISLSKVVNRKDIPGLIGIGLDESLASYIALARHSSFKEITNVKRVNFIIISSPIELMTEQRIINIYEKLYNNVTPLFEGIMFDTYDESEENKDGYTVDMKKISSIVSLAILDILESMESNDIRLILDNYFMDYITLHKDEEIRFSMQALGPDYPRINKMVDYLNAEENKYIP